MDAVEEVVAKVRDLPADQVQKVSDFIDEFDDDLGLEKDAAEAQRRYEEMKKTGESPIPAEEVFRNLGI